MQFMPNFGLLGSLPPPADNGINPATVAAVKYWIDAGAVTGVVNGATIAASDVIDLSSNARGALNATANTVYKSNAGNGKPALEFNGTTSYAQSPSFAVAQALTVFAVLKQIAWGNQKYLWDDGTALLCQAVSYRASPNIVLNGDGADFAPITTIAAVGSVALIEGHYQGAASTIATNGGIHILQDIGSTTGFAHGVIFGCPGNQLAGYFANYQLLEWLVCDSTVTAAQRVGIQNYLLKKHGISTALRPSLLICDGDSLTAPSTSAAGNYPQQLYPLLGVSNYEIVNLGLSGQTTPQMTADAVAQVDSLLGRYSRNIVICWEITNDIGNAGATGVTAYDHVVTYCQARQAAGLKVIVATCIARDDASWSPLKETYRLACNASIVLNWATFADALLDLAADPRLSDANDSTYYTAGKLHLNDTGFGVVAALAKPVIEAIP